MTRGGVNSVRRATLTASVAGWCFVVWVSLLSYQPTINALSLTWFGQRNTLNGVALTFLIVTSCVTFLLYQRVIERFITALYARYPVLLRSIVVCWGALLLVMSIISAYTELLVPSGTQWWSVAFAVLTIPIVLFVLNQNTVHERTISTATRLKFVTVLLLLMAFAAGLYVYRLGDRNLFEDEFQVVDGAAGYYYTGSFWKWDWVADVSGRDTYCPTEPPLCHYTRAWPHSWLIAQVYRVVGISEWSSRLISAVAGVVFVLLMATVTKYMTKSSAVGVGVAVVAALYPAYVNFFRMTRMYALLLPLIVLITYFLYRGITDEQRWYDRPWLQRWVGTWGRFHYGYLAAAAISIGIATTLHIIHLVILPGVVVFALYQYYHTHEKKYVCILVCASLGVATIILLWTFTDLLPESITHFIGFFTRSHIEYLRFVATYPFSPVVGIGVLLSAIAGSFVIVDAERRQRMVYLSSILCFGLLFYFFIAQRYSSFAYVLPLSIIGLILVGGLFHELWRSTIVRHYLWKSMLIIAILGSMSGILWSEYPALYGENHVYGKFSVIEQSIMAQFQPGDAIIAQYPRRYYLQSIPSDTTIVSMKYNELYSKEELISDVQRTGKGWIVWEKRKQYHLRPSVVNYINQHFEQRHGTGIDNTNVEVYYYTSAMLNN